MPALEHAAEEVKRQWRLDSGQIVPESEAGDWAPGPWPITASDVPLADDEG